MAFESPIEWTESTWNPVTGCAKISPGCKHCYAETFAERWRGIPGHPYEQGFDLKLWPQRLSLPLTWKAPRTIFVNSMSDLFHKDVPDSFVEEVFNVMERASWAQFSASHQASRAFSAMEPESLSWPKRIDRGKEALAKKRLGWSFGRVSSLCKPYGAPGPSSRRHPISLGRTSDRSCEDQCLAAPANPLGDRRRRERPEGPAHDATMGARSARPMHRRPSSILLQTVGSL